MGVSGEFGVSWAVCLAPVSQTAGVRCKSFPCPPLRQRQLQPRGHPRLQQLCPMPRPPGGQPARPCSRLTRVHMCTCAWGHKRVVRAGDPGA